MFKQHKKLSQQILSITPCAYPPVADKTNCGILPMQNSRIGLICDPDHVVSVTELSVITDKIEKIYESKGDSCICRNKQVYPCWYKFAFAFVKQLNPVVGGVDEAWGEKECPVNRNLLYQVNKKTVDSNFPDAQSIQQYGDLFTKILRERWAVSQCGEEILFLVVKDRPSQMVPKGFHNIIPGKSIPMIFASFGQAVSDRMDPVNPIVKSFLMPYQGNALMEVLKVENEKLLNGYPLLSVIDSLLDSFVQNLTKADDNVGEQKEKTHIPDWAKMVFVGCGLLCLAMAIGLWFKKNTRRSQRGKPNASDPNRRWKAGFVGGIGFLMTLINCLLF
uniref:TPM_phosphatase domain-containing protein n=1 Tax=Rhabditophanes sp. KR3021 TaxID=114890 RepID=A0AC35UC60_9BILA